MAMAASSSSLLPPCLLFPPCSHCTLDVTHRVRIGFRDCQMGVISPQNMKVAKLRVMAVIPDKQEPSSAVKSEEYNRIMQRQMRNPYEYHHELGIYYTRILDNLIVGSQPQSKDDIDRLFYEERVTTILNLQQDTDIQYWGIDFSSITKRCEELGIWYLRRPARDFDPNSLRKQLPKAVSALEWAISEGNTVYVHCTAGLGRAPAVAIAWLFWFHHMNIGTAYNLVILKRPCGPNKEAIRGATYDLAKNDPWKPAFEDLPEHAFTDVSAWERELIQGKVRSLRTH